MASVGHVAFGLAAARLATAMGERPSTVSRVCWSLLSMAPDADVAGFALGVAYGAPWGHRGASHSFAAAFAAGLATAVWARVTGRPAARLGVIGTLVVASHGVLDTFTDGGLGVALLWPFDATRYFAPWRPIPVAPIGLRYFSPYGLHVAVAELVVFAPVLAFAFWPRRAGVRPAD